MKTGYQKYKTTSVQSASREKLLLLMYEGAIRFIKKAIIAVDQNNIADRGYNIGRAYDIVLELNNTLDHKVGGEISKNLEQLYMFITEKLTEANIKARKEPLDDALRIVETLYDGWKQAIEKIKREDQAGHTLFKEET